MTTDPDDMKRDESNHFGIDPDDATPEDVPNDVLALDAVDLPVTDASTSLTPTDRDVMEVLVGLTVPEQHLLWASAHCQNNVTNGAPKNATGPNDLEIWAGSKPGRSAI